MVKMKALRDLVQVGAYQPLPRSHSSNANTYVSIPARFVSSAQVSEVILFRHLPRKHDLYLAVF